MYFAIKLIFPTIFFAKKTIYCGTIDFGSRFSFKAGKIISYIYRFFFFQLVPERRELRRNVHRKLCLIIWKLYGSPSDRSFEIIPQWHMYRVLNIHVIYHFTISRRTLGFLKLSVGHCRSNSNLLSSSLPRSVCISKHTRD